jgi:hypothetical protein
MKRHEGYETHIAAAKKRLIGTKTLADFAFVSIDKRARDIHDWIEWIVTDNLPFNFCTKQNTRKYSNISPISVNTLIKYMNKLIEKIKLSLIEEFKDKVLGLAFDGCSSYSRNQLSKPQLHQQKQSQQQTPLAMQTSYYKLTKREKPQHRATM